MSTEATADPTSTEAEFVELEEAVTPASGPASHAVVFGDEVRRPDHPIERLLVARWSPRAFSDEDIPDDVLSQLFEAARWAPSGFNSQPWRMVWGRRGTPAFERLLGLLNEANQSWANRAALLVVIASKTTLTWQGAERTNYSHSFDAGAAWQNLALQASALGWNAHGMTGLDVERATTELGLPSGHRIEAAVAIGRQAAPTSLNEPWRSIERPSDRERIAHFAFEGRFPRRASEAPDRQDDGSQE